MISRSFAFTVKSPMHYQTRSVDLHFSSMTEQVATTGRSCWKKKNDVAKMRQAGTAPATGATIYCLTSLWCIVIYKLLVPCRCYQHTSASECASRTSIGPMSDLLCYLWMYLEFGVSEYSSSYVGASLERFVAISTDRMRHLDKYGAACALKSALFVEVLC